jgi:hypothetical protein
MRAVNLYFAVAKNMKSGFGMWPFVDDKLEDDHDPLCAPFQLDSAYRSSPISLFDPNSDYSTCLSKTPPFLFFSRHMFPNIAPFEMKRNFGDYGISGTGCCLSSSIATC